MNFPPRTTGEGFSFFFFTSLPLSESDFLKSICGGSSKIYAGLYNGTPVQIYPTTSKFNMSLYTSFDKSISFKKTSSTSSTNVDIISSTLSADLLNYYIQIYVHGTLKTTGGGNGSIGFTASHTNTAYTQPISQNYIASGITITNTDTDVIMYTYPILWGYDNGINLQVYKYGDNGYYVNGTLTIDIYSTNEPIVNSII